MAFTPNANQLSKLRKAVRSYNSAVGRLSASGKFTSVPFKTSMAREKEFISSAQDLNLRVKQLRRILTTEKKGTQDPVEFHGEVMPKYMRDEIKNIIKSSNERRKAIRSELFPDFDELTPIQQAPLLSNKNLMPLDEADYSTPQDYEDLLEEEYPNIPFKAELYIDTWLSNKGDPEIARIIREIATENPDGFKKLMESADIEKDVEYVYPDEQTAKTRGSAYKEPMINRYNKAAAYWRQQYSDYKAGKGYFK